MKKTIIFLFLLNIMVILTAQSKENLLQYSVYAETNLEADFVKLTVRIEKKDKSFDKASRKCNEIINKIATYLQEQGMPAENIYKTKFNIQLNTGFFNKEVTVSSNLSIKINEQTQFQAIVAEMQKIDNTLELCNITYSLENKTKDKIRKELIKIASARANEIKTEYEKNLFITLKLYSLDEITESNMISEGPPGFDNNISPAYKSTMEYDNNNEESSFPIFHFKLILLLKYQIISG